MTDDEFIASFENGNLDIASFHHADHVRMAFLYVCRYPALEALERFSDGLLRFAAANGKSNLYHETITWAFLLLIRERLARAGSQQTWAEFEAGNADLLNWKENVGLRSGIATGRPKVPLTITDDERIQMTSLAGSRTLPHALVARAKLILWSSQDETNSQIAAA